MYAGTRFAMSICASLPHDRLALFQLTRVPCAGGGTGEAGYKAGHRHSATDRELAMYALVTRLKSPPLPMLIIGTVIAIDSGRNR